MAIGHQNQDLFDLGRKRYGRLQVIQSVAKFLSAVQHVGNHRSFDWSFTVLHVIGYLKSREECLSQMALLF